MTLTQQQLQQILPKNKYIEHWYQAFLDILPSYDITTNLRVAAFIAQCAHESAQFTVLEENLNYRASSLQKVFPKYFPNAELAQQFANKPEAIANRVYANRMGNRDSTSGDGYKYRGRGLIQLTGYNNYIKFAESMDINIEDALDYVVTFEGAVYSACWFWQTNNLNRLADSGDMIAITKRINGGVNGLEDRMAYYKPILITLES